MEIANEWETGIKLETAGGRASATLAWFDLTKRNVGSSVLEPAIDNLGVAFLMHKATNRGLEIDFHGEILPGLQLLASYAYIDSRVDNTVFPWMGEPPKGSELLGQTGDRLVADGGPNAERNRRRKTAEHQERQPAKGHQNVLDEI